MTTRGRVRGLLAWAAAVAAIVVAATVASPAAAHDERPTRQLVGTGTVPTYRATGAALLVCKTDRADFESRIAAFPADLKAENLRLFDECQRGGYRDLQAAVDSVTGAGQTIKMLPGLYQELPSQAPPSGECANLVGIRTSALYHYQVLTLEQQIRCPHNQNLVGIFNIDALQIEGTGAEPTDVVLDGQYEKLNVLRADNADGFYLRNMTVQRSQFNAVYIMETDGFVIDHAVGRWNDEYGFLTFAVDHGLYTEAEGYGNGDSAFYPGAASDINKGRGYDVPRYAVEIRDSYGHDNMLGYSGTAGDSVWVHDSVFTNNSTGISTDSAFPDHPGMPQNHSLFENNIIANNNHDYYGYFGDGTCQKPYAERGYEDGVVCPVVGVPVGAGVINPGGNYNVWRGNHVYGNELAGFVTSWVPGFVRADNGIAAQFDTSHHNRYLDNHMGVTEDGAAAPNGADYWWDGQGIASCWRTASDSVDVASNIGPLPTCGADDLPAATASRRLLGEPTATLKMYVCSGYSLQGGSMPGSCDWWGAYGARGLERIEVRWAVGEAVLVVLLLLGLLVRRARGRGLPAVLLVAAGMGVVIGGVWLVDPRIEAAGLAVAGVGWLLAGVLLRRAGSSRLGWLSVLIGLFALAGAVDRGLVMLPYLPVSPAFLRIVTEYVWVCAALVGIVLGPRRRRRTPEAAGEAAVPVG
ncbi:MAG: hypothetical protein R2731_12345 [Nocardioides sp.]